MDLHVSPSQYRSPLGPFETSWVTKLYDYERFSITPGYKNRRHLKPHFMIHEIVELFHHYLLKHIQVSNQDVWLLSNIEPGLEPFQS